MRDEDGAPLLPSRVPIGGIVQLKRERGSATRPEAIAAYHDRRKVGYLPQEKRWIWEALNDSRHTVIVVGQVATTSGEIIAFDVEITVAERLPARIRRTSVTRQKRLLRLMPAFAALALTFATLVALERVDRKGDTASPESPPNAAVESKQAGVPPASRGPTFGAVATAPLVAALEARRAARDGRIEPDVISGSLQTETAFQDMRVGRRTIGRLVEDRPRDDATTAAKPSEPSVAKPLPRPLSRPTKTAARPLDVAARTEAAAGLAVDGPIRPSFPAFAFAHGMAGLAASTREPAAASEPERETAQPLPEASDAAPASPAAKPVIIVKPRAKPIRKLAKPIVAKPKPPAKQKKKRNPPPLAPRSPSGNAAESPDW